MESRKTLNYVLTLIAFVSLIIINPGCSKDLPSGSIDYSLSSHWLSKPAPVKPVDVF